jgi:hypothetical protein
MEGLTGVQLWLSGAATFPGEVILTRMLSGVAVQIN